MKNWKLLVVIICCVVLGGPKAGALIYHEQTQKVTHFDYSGFEYTYEENGVTKTANILDEATTPNQMAALLKEVYLNKDIPGIRYAYDYNRTQNRKLNYNFNGHLIALDKGYEWQRDKSTFFPNPDEDGMTMILVQMKQSWKKNQATNTTPEQYIDRAYRSMHVVKNFTRVNDAQNPGYIFSIDGVSTNRFFFISKGKARQSWSRPLYRLFEQISPVKGDDGHDTNDLIDQLRAGNAYYCYHDCFEVGTATTGGYDHWFTISNQGEAFSLKNLAIFVPDRRFEYQQSPENFPEEDNNASAPYYHDYGNSDQAESEWNRDIMPKVLMYTANLNAEAVPSDQEDYYQVNLNWSTSFSKEVLGLGAELLEHFYVYVVEGNERIPLAEIQTDEDGLIVTRQHSYLVQQHADPQTICYVITAQPINYDIDGSVIRDGEGNPLITIQAESPVRYVTIPGKNSAFFTEVLEYRSRYTVGDGKTRQWNVYKNNIAIRPASSEEFDAIKNNNDAYLLTRTDAEGNKVTIANLQFSQEENQVGYHYTIVYNADSQVLNPVFDDEQPVLEGFIENYANSTVKLIDRFTAETADNTQSPYYIYHLEQAENSRSNEFMVPVYKTTNQVEGKGHTVEQVKADVDHSLKATPNNLITFGAINDPTANLVEYDVFRMNYQYRNPTKVGKAENYNNSGEYHVYALNEQSQLNEQVSNSWISVEGGDITVPDVNSSSTNQQSLYVPVISALFAGDLTKENTYGCDVKSMSYPQVEMTVSETVRTDPEQAFQAVVNGTMGPTLAYGATITLTPKLPTELPNAYYYRVWRVVSGETLLDPETLLNTQEGVQGPMASDGTYEWFSDYDAITITFPGNEPVVIRDIFLDKKLTDNKNKYVTYIGRLYATNQEGESEFVDVVRNHAPRLIGESATDGQDYFVAEATRRINFGSSGNVVTAIGDVSASRQVASVTYYNMLGVPSPRPYQGVNVVVTRYQNGTTETKKVIR